MTESDELPSEIIGRRETFYRQMATIRLFEERLLELFGQGKLNGTTHTYLGQEADAVGVISHLEPRDTIFTSHRSHGHYLARFDDPAGLLGEVMGRDNGVCRGRGGSQHLCRENYYSSGIQGGYMPIVTGIALAEKRLGSGAIAVAFIGDGTLGEGSTYEALNMMSLWSAPVLLVIENNRYAQTTPVEMVLAGDMVARAAAFGLSVGQIETNDVEILFDRFGPIVETVRKTQRPHVEVVHTYRLGPHSKGDDFRDPEEIASWRRRDPLSILGNRLPPETRETIDKEVQARLAAIEAEVESRPLATLANPRKSAVASAIR